MTNLTQKSSMQFFGAGVRLVTLALFLMVFTAGAALAQTRAYVSNTNDGFISVIDTATNNVVSNIPIAGFPDGLAVTPDGAFIYVLSRSNGAVQVISTATETIVASVPVGVGQGPVEISPNGAFAYYGDDSGTVWVISTATNTLAATIPIGGFIPSIAFTPDSAFAYVGSDSGDLKVIDTATNTVSATVHYSTGFPFDEPRRVSITPNGAFAYVGVESNSSSRLSIVSTATNMEVASLPLPSAITAFTPDGAFAYLSTRDDDTVKVLDTATNTVVATVSVPSPRDIAITPDGAFAYVGNLDDATVTVISTATNTIVATVPVGLDPQYLAIATLPPTIASLIAQVQALVTAAVLSQHEADELIKKLENAQDKIDKGNTNATCNQLDSFINKVNHLINTSTLTQAQGQALINGANAIKASNGC